MLNMESVIILPVQNVFVQVLSQVKVQGAQSSNKENRKGPNQNIGTCNLRIRNHNVLVINRIKRLVQSQTLCSKICGKDPLGDASPPFLPVGVCRQHDPHHTNPKTDDSQEQPYCCPYHPGLHLSLLWGSF